MQQTLTPELIEPLVRISSLRSQTTSGTTLRQYAMALFAVALLVRIAVIVHYHIYQDLDRYELERTALSLATTGVYGNPYYLPTGPTAHVAPGYPIILAGIYRLFGAGMFAELIKNVLAAAVSSFAWALLPWIAVALGLDWRAGLLAGGFGSIFALWPMLEGQGDWESPYIVVCLMVAAALTARLWAQRGFTIRSGALHGVFWGAGLLFAPTILPSFWVTTVLGFFFAHDKWKAYLRFAALELLCALLCVAPWAIRNYYALGSPIFTRSNLGIELRLSNNDRASPEMDRNYHKGLFRLYHPLFSREQALELRRMGEVAFNRQAKAETEQWIRSHPVRFTQLCMGRARFFWFNFDPHTLLSFVKTSFSVAVNILGLVALVLLCLQRHVAGLVLGLIAVVYPLPYYIIQGTERYSYPIEWMMMLLAATLLFQVLHGRPGRGKRVKQSPTLTASRHHVNLITADLITANPTTADLCRRVWGIVCGRYPARIRRK